MGEFQPEDSRLCPEVQSITYRMSAAKWDMKTEIHFQEVRNFPSFDATHCQCCTDLPYIMTTSSWIYKYPNTSLISDQMWRLKVSFIVYKTYHITLIYPDSVSTCGDHIFSISFHTHVRRRWKATKVNFSSWYPFIILSSPSCRRPLPFLVNHIFRRGPRVYIFI